MGKRSRRKRALIKDLSRRLNYREDEFGRVRHKTTKAEARRRFVEHRLMLRAAEHEIMRCISEKIKQEIDQEVFAQLDKAARPMEA